MSEAEKRRELQSLLLREGYTQDEARLAAAEWTMVQIDSVLEGLRVSAIRHPERQILPPGTVDLVDLKSKREAKLDEREEQVYFIKRDQLAALMTQLFSVDELPTAVLMALITVMTEAGVDHLTAVERIGAVIGMQRKIAEAT